MNLFVIFFVINALFWGLATHGQHCRAAAQMGFTNCPSHTVHLIMGLVSYLIAVGIAQKDYLF